MDLSGVLDRIHTEIRDYSQPPSELASLEFENHLYGCLCVLEILAEGGDDLSGGKIQTGADLSANFSAIGPEFGFFHDERCLHEGWSNSYRDSWLWLWETVGRVGRDLSGVEMIESALIGQITDLSGSLFRFFKVALQDGDIPAELYDECTGLVDSMKKPATKKLRGTEFTRRVHGRRGITPMRKRVGGAGADAVRRRFRKTRRRE
jgi:hypothetical protein